MVRILQIIFALDAVAGKLRVARHALVFFEELRGIATLAIVLAVARLPAAEVPTSTLSPTTAPAAALSIVDQILKSLDWLLAPFASGGQGGASAPALTLSFRSAHTKRELNGRLRRGWVRERSAVDLERARPRTLM
jgi:hypothetical protein